MARYYWIDNVKAIAIFLVVAGHFGFSSTFLKDAVYAFHVPVFLIVTGFLIVPKFSEMEFRYFSKKYLIRFVVLYALFSIMASLHWFLRSGVSYDDLFSIWKPLYGSLYGVSGQEQLFFHLNRPLWYLPFMITSLVVMYVLYKLPLLYKTTFLGLFAIFGFVYDGVRLPWCIDIAGVGALFLYIGALLRQYVNFDGVRGNKDFLFLLPLWVFIFVYSAQLNGDVNINRVLFGSNSFLFVLNAFFGFMILMIISAKIPENKVLKEISAHTLFIFCTHIFLVKVMKKLLSGLDGIFHDLAVFVCAVVVTVICYGVSKVVMPLIERYILNPIYEKKYVLRRV